MSKWIPVTEKMPEDDQTIIVFTKYGYVFMCEYRWKSFFINCECYDGDNAYDVTHWMDCPDGPEETNEQQ